MHVKLVNFTEYTYMERATALHSTNFIRPSSSVPAGSVIYQQFGAWGLTGLVPITPGYFLMVIMVFTVWQKLTVRAGIT